MGYVKEPVETLEQQWQHHRREVRRLHEKLFYRPLLTSVAQLSGGEARLTPEAATQRLAALGFADPAAALRHLEALTAGVTRTANIQRQLLPAMLDWFADAPDPDAGLFGFRRISESLGRTPWYLKTLRDEGEVAERLARLLATSRYASDLLEKEPAGVRMLGEDLSPLDAEPVVEEMLAAAGRRDDAEAAVRAIRAVRRRELFRVAAGDLLGVIDVADVGAALSRITDATLEATLRVVMESVAAARGLDDPPTRMAIVAMGRYGGFELSYGSDADVLFVHEPRRRASTSTRRRRTPWPSATSCAGCSRCPAATRRWTSTPTSGRRASRGRWCAAWTPTRPTTPSGRRSGRRRRCSGPTPWSATPTCGGGSRSSSTRCGSPRPGWPRTDVVEVRRIKARVDQERLPRGADPQSHLKLGRGGLADIEWTVQLLQMRHAGTVPGLRTSRTLEALTAAATRSCSRPSDADVLISGWRWVSRVRNAITLVRGKGSDQLPARHPGAGGGRERARLPGRGHRRDGQRPPADHAGLARRRGPGVLGVTTVPAGVKLRVHQQEALAALAGAWAAGRTRAWVALPPGAGKTLVGLKTVQDRVARRRGRQGRRARPEHRDPGPVGRPGHGARLDVGTDRSLAHQLTALTYQALAVFDPDNEVDDDGRQTP